MGVWGKYAGGGGTGSDCENGSPAVVSRCEMLHNEVMSGARESPSLLSKVCVECVDPFDANDRNES